MGIDPTVVRAQRRRMKRGLSIRAAAVEAGVGFASWARWERGVGLPDAASLDRLVRWLDGEPAPPGRRRAVGGEALAARLDEHEARIEKLERRGALVQR